jgi:phage-related protein
LKDRDLEFWDDREWKAFIKEWPEELREYFGTRLRTIQRGGHPASGAKPLSDFDIKLGELKHRDGTRVVYTTEYATLTNCIHVLDAFLKDSREGSKMRSSDRTRIEARVKALKERMKPLEAEAKARKRGLH